MVTEEHQEQWPFGEYKIVFGVENGGERGLLLNKIYLHLEGRYITVEAEGSQPTAIARGIIAETVVRTIYHEHGSQLALVPGFKQSSQDKQEYLALK